MKDILILAAVGVAGYLFLTYGYNISPNVTTSGTAPTPTQTTNAGTTASAATKAGTATNVAPQGFIGGVFLDPLTGKPAAGACAANPNFPGCK